MICAKILCRRKAEPHAKGGIAFSLLLSAFCLLPSRAVAQQPAAKTEEPPPQSAQTNGETPLPGDWAAELLDAILTSPNPEARDALYRAAFAAGPDIVPQLEEALKDDRTAEFAAQALAFIGGEKAMEILARLQQDKRDLNLRRFYYGALSEPDSPQALDTLLDVISKSDAEPDRAVTETAILALSVRSDPKLLPRIREAETKVQDVVIHDDLENALAIIGERVKYLASLPGRRLGGSVDAAVRSYFLPALETPPPSEAPVRPTSAPTPGKSPPSREAPRPRVAVEIRHLTYSPDKARALARVTFEDSSAIAEYDLVLQKRPGGWGVASAWLQAEAEKPAPQKPTGRKP